MKDPADHYEYLADFLAKSALLAEGALIFGQFVPGFQINWLVVACGTVFTVGAITVGYVLKRKSYRLSQIHLP